MKKIISFILIAFLCIGIYIGIQPNEYSFYSDQPIESNYPFIKLDLGTQETYGSVLSQSISQGKYQAKVKLFGFLPIKTARINIIDNKKVVPLGKPFGVKLYTEGVMIVDITDFLHNGKIQNPAYTAGVREGDIIISYNGVKITSNEQLVKQVKLYNGSPQKAVIRRNNLTFDVDITPLTDDSDGNYRIGLWVRDSTAGIGMLTYFDPITNSLVGLGHSISDSDTGVVMPVSTGEVISAKIDGVVKGVSGTPGELLGSFIEESVIGVLTDNLKTGLVATCVTEKFSKLESYPLAIKDDIKTGPAKILSCVNGTEGEWYDIEIVKKNNNLQETKNMVIKITDPDLIDRTGGIVQGMSGSPIIQNGKLIGAVTHVLVDDPTRGYGIFIENMLETTQSVAKEEKLKEAS